ncbi:MAG: dephospho-CoA kinase [Bdellovibrionales bacterium]
MTRQKKPLILGLTGPIGAGKSTIAQMFAKRGFPIFSSDLYVHELLSKDPPTIAKIEKKIPQAVVGGTVDRALLAQHVFNNPSQRVWLEKIIHPAVFKAIRSFIATAKEKGNKGVILEIPLLFETGYESQCDLTLCVVANAIVQKARVMKRQGMSPSTYRRIKASQLSDCEKKKRADYVIQNSSTKRAAEKQVEALIEKVWGKDHA